MTYVETEFKVVHHEGRHFTPVACVADGTGIAEGHKLEHGNTHIEYGISLVRPRVTISLFLYMCSSACRCMRRPRSSNEGH